MAKSCLKIHMENSKHTSSLKYLVDGLIRLVLFVCFFYLFILKAQSRSSCQSAFLKYIVHSPLCDSFISCDWFHARFWNCKDYDLVSFFKESPISWGWWPRKQVIATLMTKVSAGSAKQEPFTPCGSIRGDFSVKRIFEHVLMKEQGLRVQKNIFSTAVNCPSRWQGKTSEWFWADQL